MSLKVCMIGTGYVGLVTGTCLADIGHNVVCCDIDDKKISKLNEKKIPIYEQGLEEILIKNFKSGRLEFSTNISQSIKKSDLIFIAVGTPEMKNGQADISAVKSVANTISNNLNKYKVICVKCTVPLETYDIIEKILKKSGNKRKFDLVSNPEFLREGSSVKDFFYPDRIIIGTESERAYKYLCELYKPLFKRDLPVVKCNIPTAIIIKYASNSFLAVKISFINEIASLCDKSGGDVLTVSRALGMDGRISEKFLHPGPGFGGSCFPKDTKALVHMSNKHKANSMIVNAAISSNKLQKKLILKKLTILMKNNFKGKTVSVLGLAFKAQTDDVRDSASIELIKFLINRGAKINAYDPEAIENMKKIYPNINYYSDWKNACKRSHCVVLMTEWHEFRSINLKHLAILLSKRVILDARNIISIEQMKKNKFSYATIGRGLKI